MNEEERIVQDIYDQANRLSQLMNDAERIGICVKLNVHTYPQLNGQVSTMISVEASKKILPRPYVTYTGVP